MSKEMHESGKVCTVELSTLNVDESYQRDKRPHRHKIEREFEPAACGELLVGERKDGSRWIIDGQQRFEAMKARGITHWRARIIPSAGPAQEAHIYKIVNGGTGTVRRITGRDLFRSQVVEGDPVALAVVNAVEAAGLEFVGGHKQRSTWPYLGNFQALCQYVRQFDAPTVRDALKLIVECWKGSDHAMNGVVINSVILVVGCNECIDRERLQRVLTAIPATTILQEAQVGNVGGHLANAYAFIIRRYNRGLRTKLDENVRSAAQANRFLRSSVDREVPVASTVKDLREERWNDSQVTKETRQAIAGMIEDNGGEMLATEAVRQSGLSRGTIDKCMKNHSEQFTYRCVDGGGGRKAIYIGLVDRNGSE